MALNAALGGPGPSTRLFRQLQLASSRLVGASMPPRRHLASSAGVGNSTTPSSRHAGARHMSSIPPSQTGTSAKGPSILAPAPTAGASEYLGALRSAMEEKNLGKLILAWGDLVEHQGTDACLDSDYAAISGVVDTALSNPRLKIMKLYSSAPKQFARLQHMALEAAARDKWKGLHRLQLKLLASGLPSVAVSTFSDFKRRRRAIEGKQDISGLNSHDREDRLAARLTGEGLRPLMLVHFASLTMLDQFDNAHIAELLDSTADFRSISSAEWADIRRMLLRANGGVDGLVKKFMRNLERYHLIVKVYHADALNARVMTLAQEGERKAILELYDDIMAASIGKGRLIVPQDLNEAGRLKYHSNIPLAISTWLSFMDAFGQLGELDRIVKMLTVDIPLRYDGKPPNEPVLAYAMQTLCFMSVAPRFARATRKEAMAQSDRIWEAMVEAGMQSARTIGKRITALSLFDRNDEVEKLYEDGLAALRQQQVANQDVWLDVSMFTHHCRTKKIGRAEHLLATRRKSDPDVENDMLQVLVRSALTSPLPYKDRQRLYRALMKHKAPGAKIYSRSWGIILRYLIEGNNDLHSACRMICTNSKDSEIIRWYTNLLLGLLGRGFRPPERREYEAAVFVLTTLVPHLEYVTQTNYMTLWRTAARPIALSTTIEAHERHEYIEALLGSFPGNKHSLSLLHGSIMRYSSSRDDAQGVPEAMHHYNLVDKPISNRPSYNNLIEYLVKHGFPQLAQEVVDDIPRTPKYSSVLNLARRRGLVVDGGVAVGAEGRAPDDAPTAEDKTTLEELVEEAEEEAEDGSEGSSVRAEREFSVQR